MSNDPAVDPAVADAPPIDRSQPQLTARAVVAGMLLGGFMSLSNLYTSLKLGWSFGVSITAGILAWAIFLILHRMRVTRTHFGILENNAMQSVASAAGYMTGGGTAAAIPALMMISGERMDPLKMFVWIGAIAMLGVVMAIPMKQQMINIEKLTFPSGVAAAETLRALHASGDDSRAQAIWLAISAGFGAVISFLRDVKATWKPWALPGQFEFPGLLAGQPFSKFTLAIEGSGIMIGAGAIMGFRSAWSMLLGAGINYLLLAPWLYREGIIDAKLGYKNIVAWSVWLGSSMLLTSGLLSFAFQWRSVARALRSTLDAFQGRGKEDEEVPMSWFFAGVVVFGALVVALEKLFFDIPVWMGVISVLLGFFTAIVASRVTGETDTTPTGALGKITQITFGVLSPGNITTNLMTANVTGGVGLHAADLLTDMKSGYLLGADPRQQFWAQFFGVTAGSFAVVGAFNILIKSPDDLGTDKWPAPGAITWKNVAEMLAKGFDTMEPTAQIALLVGGGIGIALVLLERFLPKLKPWIPSPSGLGLAFTTPGYNTLSMFIGAVIALVLQKTNPKLAGRVIVPVSSGLIAGESLMAVAVAVGAWMGWIEG